MSKIDIENYLSQKNEQLDSNILEQIEDLRILSINKKDEIQANYFWCLKQIFIIQNGFVLAINALKEKKYEEAWLTLDNIDIELSYLENNFNIDEGNDKFHLTFIGRILKEYQKLFPYHLFFSRESIVKAEECSICGQPISLRHPCGHKVGKLYMGELCLSKVTDMELKAVCIVTDPFDKYTFIKPIEKEYNYGVLDEFMQEIKSPYDDFYIETIKVKQPKYQNISRKAPCPCGSGKKYKRCHLGKTSEMMDYNIIHWQKPVTQKSGFIGIFGTWK